MDSNAKQVYLDQYTQAMEEYRRKVKEFTQDTEEIEPIKIETINSAPMEHVSSPDFPILFMDPVPSACTSHKLSLKPDQVKSLFAKDLSKPILQLPKPIPPKEWFEAADLEPLPLPPAWKSTREY